MIVIDYPRGTRTVSRGFVNRAQAVAYARMRRQIWDRTTR